MVYSYELTLLAMDLSEAKRLVSKHLEGIRLQDDSAVIIDSAIMAKSYGWVFFYDSRKHVETGNISYALAGNGPIIVLKSSGELVALTTAVPVLEAIEMFERSRNLNVH